MESAIRLMEDSHFDYATDVDNTTDAYDEVTFALDETAILRLDDYSGNELENLFSAENGSADGTTEIGDHDYNNIRTADMMDIKCIALVRGKRPTEDMIAIAEDKGIALISSDHRMYSACGTLYAEGLQPGETTV